MHIKIMILTTEGRNRGHLNYTYDVFFIKNTEANVVKVNNSKFWKGDT